jgi:hypothetical protein
VNKSSTTLGPYQVVPPGGPAGPFYGLINERGNVVALQIVGEANARFLAASWEMWQQLVTLWNNPAVLAALDDEQLAAFQQFMINE